MTPQGFPLVIGQRVGGVYRGFLVVGWLDRDVRPIPVVVPLDSQGRATDFQRDELWHVEVFGQGWDRTED